MKNMIFKSSQIKLHALLNLTKWNVVFEQLHSLMEVESETELEIFAEMKQKV